MYRTEHGQRWNMKPANLVPAGLLQDAAPPRELHQVRPPIAPWGNAMLLELEHAAEIASIEAAAWRAHDPRLQVAA